MLRTSRAGSASRPHNGGSAGYILLELVAALALIGFLVVMAFPALTQGTNQPRFRALSIGTATLLRDARTSAIARGSEVYAVFDRRRRTIQTGKHVVSIPTDVEVGLLAGSRCEASGERIVIAFRADGSNCGGVFRFARGDRTSRVRLNWLTGHVEILQGSG
ncbi:hypothetical protein [Tardiphaga sp.]|uniref:hypothetical protein n=1 Tax=Tardiphaga sp. TaxID=1926292 RepID=UPI00352A601F